MSVINSILIAFSIFALLLIVSSRPSEQERVRLWYEAGNVWPPEWQDASPEFKRRMLERETEIMSLTGANERWENWMQFTQSQLVRKFTPSGFSLRTLPKKVYADLTAVLNKALLDWDSIPTESEVDAIYGPTQPRLVPTGHMVDDILEALKPYHEDWVDGIELMGTSAYGIRIYTNGSSLVMHNDKPHTHVISSIIFLGAEYDNPDVEWPIQIEDHDGKLHEVNLKPGQMLHYESARCPHGRMKPFKGKWYAAIFVHYQPINKALWDYDIEQVIASVPPHWGNGVLEDEGSRWAGQAFTFDSLAAFGAPPRLVEGKFVHNDVSPYAFYQSDGDDKTSHRQRLEL